MALSSRSLTLYADYACPFCYLEQQSLVEYCETHSERPRIDWYPYDIRYQKRTPEGSLDPEVDIGYPERVHTKISGLAQEHDNGSMISPADVPLVDSLPAQIASRYVKHEYPDHWFSFNDQIFTALWCNGLNISDTEILCDLAVKCGLNKDAVKTPLREVDAREQLLAQCAEARNAGIDDVPTLIYGNRSLHEVVSANKLTEFIHDDS